jgi:hypothetical protein
MRTVVSIALAALVSISVAFAADELDLESVFVLLFREGG